MSKKCVLCGEPLNNGKPLNREHYIFASCVRRFKKLDVPDEWTHALRIDMCEDGTEALLAPRSAHREWAVTLTHAQCNSDSSHVCMDLIYLIENMDSKNLPESKINNVRAYYANLWRLKISEVFFEIIAPDNVSKKEFDLIYAPGILSIGRIQIYAKDENSAYCPSEEYYSIFMGSKKALESLL